MTCNQIRHAGTLTTRELRINPYTRTRACLSLKVRDVSSHRKEAVDEEVKHFTRKRYSFQV